MRCVKLTATVVALFTSLSLISISNPQAQVFSLGNRYTVDTVPITMVAADFDGDLDLDLAVGDREDSSLIIFSNDGSANFTISERRTTFLMRQLFTADLNGDGLNDLMACEEFSSFVRFWYSNGDGTFHVGQSYDFGSWPEALCAADFDGDGIVDVAFNNRWDGSGIGIKFGTGGGEFAPSTIIVPDVTGSDLVAGDLDNDGDQDIVYDGVTTILNNGDGTFGDPIVAPSVLHNLVLAHLNDDSYLDLAGTGTYACAGTPASMLGTGTGTFMARDWAWTIAGSPGAVSLVAMDFSGDGYVDIAICGADTNSMECGFNNGRSVFPTQEELFFQQGGIDTGGYALAGGDFDGDGDNDLALTTGNQGLRILLSGAAQHDRRIYVPGDAPTIQDAIDMAWNFDTIVVQPGTYTENLDFGGKNLFVVSSDYFDESARSSRPPGLSSSATTIIDGGGTGRIFTFDDGEDDRSVVAGFTLQNGHGAGYGGAIFCYDTASPTIINNIIKDNYSTSVGGGIFLAGGHSEVKNNLIVGNSSGFLGGGVYMSGYYGNFVNNTVYGNSTVSGGGGICLGYGSPTICNNIIWANESDSAGQQIEYPVTVVSYCVVEGGWPGTGNISDDPMFVDCAGGDFTLLPGSPCIDAGDPSGPLDPDGSPADIGAFCYQDPLDVGDSDDRPDLPYIFELAQNYPNPFNPATTIQYSVPRKSHVTISVINILGRRVRTLVECEKPAGRHSVTWDGKDDAGHLVATGVYLYRLQTENGTESRKMLLLK